MSMVDLKSKGITWVGDIYQKFGSIWDDADDVECQDTVKYVEGQVQSVKRFCTNVVQDLLPPRGDSVYHKGQRVLFKRNAVIEKTVNTENFSVDTILKESLTDSMTADTVKDQFGELDLVNQLTPSSTEQTEDILTEVKSDVRIEENLVEDKSTVRKAGLISPSEKQYCKSSLFSEVSDDNNENSSSSLDDVSPATSVYGENFEFSSKVRTVNSYFAVDLDSPAASSSTTYSEMECSAFSCEKQVEQVGFVSPSSSRLTESYSESGNSSENFPTDVVSYDESASSNVSSTERSNVVLSSTLTQMISSENDAVVAHPISSNSDPLLESPVGFSEDSADMFTDLGMETIDIITDPDMETIDLFDEVKAEESCVSVNNRELYAAARRAQKMRSYKKKIQDAFASKKRLAKEYELLAIWFGDTDIGDTSRTSLSSTSTTAKPLDSRSLQTNHPSDSDWELL